MRRVKKRTAKSGISAAAGTVRQVVFHVKPLKSDLRPEIIQPAASTQEMRRQRFVYSGLRIYWSAVHCLAGRALPHREYSGGQRPPYVMFSFLCVSAPLR
jgi:hypothetical protein